ncbi:hypothetical protein AQ731_19065 [Burkholderia pseudomallei]|nr:hypothetical protein AM256_28795 [Burkholderia pseudomallei]ALC03568.1 hypothetical protein AM257_28830 [Burkholderia pseudomallei]KIX44005.1 hypothetical protein SZ28_04115 [Burkholderia pseudomallei]KNA32098.1 hypothetical protein ADU20_22400 [Burkholderia pseudomallei]OMR91814.1 hypothetical protein AQ731_19065 [Burkholderia pseudomallei]
MRRCVDARCAERACAPSLRHRFVMRSCAIQMPMRGDRHADPRIGGARRASCTPRERMRRAVRVTRGDSRVRCAAA